MEELALIASQRQDKVCSICGNIGHYGALKTCSQCKISEHKYCMKIESTKDTNQDCKEWQCESCGITDTYIPPYKYLRLPPIKGKGKVKFIAEICNRPVLEKGKKRCKSPDLCTKVSSAFAKRSKPSASKMDASCKAIVKERATGMMASVLPPIKVEVADFPIESDYLDNNIQTNGTHVEELMKPFGLRWKGELVILKPNSILYVQARFPETIARKAYNALRRIPQRLIVELHPCVKIWPKSIDKDGFCYQDFALYLSPDNNFRQEYNRILNYITDRDLGMRCRPNGVDLLFFSSKKLPLNDQRRDGELYLCGIFCSKKCKDHMNIPPGFTKHRSFD